MKAVLLLIIFILQILFVYVNLTQQTSNENETVLIRQIKKSITEKQAINHLKEYIYNNGELVNSELLKYLSAKKWLKATRILLDFGFNLKTDDYQEDIKDIIANFNNYLTSIKNTLASKKKNIVVISPIFEWSQSDKLVKVRIKFAKSIESPGEKDIKDFKVKCERTRIRFSGYKVHEEYVAYYYRMIHTYEFLKPYSCTLYKETDGSYVLKFEKGQVTLYWNFLDLPTDSHENMFTWFDVFHKFESKKRYTEFRDWTQDNRLEAELKDYVSQKVEEKKKRVNKINSLLSQLKTKDAESKNFCNSPIDMNFCLLPDMHDWNYWLY